MGAACVFATAYSVATWYFAPGTSRSGKARHLPLAPAIEGEVAEEKGEGTRWRVV